VEVFAQKYPPAQLSNAYKPYIQPPMKGAEEQLLALLAEYGTLGNTKARQLLGWNETTYEEVKQALVAAGQVAIGRGRGGSIRLAEPNGQLASEPVGLMANGLTATQPPPVPYPLPKRSPDRPPKAPKPLAENPKTTNPEAPEPMASKATKPKVETIVEIKQLTLNQLESHLWASANILRGAVDASDFKTFIFPLLFFERISDVFDEERVTLR